MSQQQLFDVAETERMLSGMEMEQVMQALLKVRTTQKVGSKKRAAKRAAERAMKLKPKPVRLSVKAMTQIARSMPSPSPGYASMYDFILSEADLRADALLASAGEKDSLSDKGTPS